MRKEILFAVATVLFAAFVGVNSANAQDAPKVEVGGQYTLLRLSGESFNGFGGTFTYNVHESVGADVAFNFFPGKDFGGGVDFGLTQGFFGAKYGIRSEKAGIFGKFRPGFVRFKSSAGGVSVTDTNFAMDIGGVLELYSSRSVGFRFDIGDTIIRSGGGNSNNMQIGAGVMFRF